MMVAVIVFAVLAAGGWFAFWTAQDQAAMLRLERDDADRHAAQSARRAAEALRECDRFADERELAACRTTVRVMQHAERVRSQ